MNEILREFKGGVWGGQWRYVGKDAMAVIGQRGELWSGYVLKGEAFDEVKTGGEHECRISADAADAVPLVEVTP